MLTISEQLQQTATELLSTGKAEVVIGYTPGDRPGQSVPHFAMTPEEGKRLIFDEHCEKALSKYLLQPALEGKKAAVVLKGCDHRALELLLAEHRLNREDLYLIGVACSGLSDSPFCKSCKQPAPPEAAVDRLLRGEKDAGNGDIEPGEASYKEAFQEIQKIENLSEEERYQFWKGHLNRCKRCYSCRNACPVCTCRVCIFDRQRENFLDPAKDQPAQHQFFHIIRAFHSADRCVGCGECARVCPENIPLHLLHQKLKGDLEEYYGAYEAGMDALPAPLSRADAGERDFFGKEGAE